MKYIIVNEEELWDLLKNPQYDSTADTIKDFLKSKIPVEEIAKGEVKDNSLLPGVVSYKVGDIDDIKIFYNIYNRQSKNIKIYIEVIK